MQPFYKKFFHLFAICLCIVASGTSRASSCENPDTLHVADIYQGEVGGFADQTELLKDYLEKTIGKKVTLLRAKSYVESMKLMQSGRVDIARTGSKVYVRSRESNPSVEVFATFVNLRSSQLGETGYHTQLIVRGDSPFDSVSSLKDRRLALVGPGSTSGYLVPHVLFRDQIEMPLEQYFKRIMNSGSHEQSLNAVISNRVDGAFVASPLIAVLVNAGALNQDDIRVLWTSPVIPREPLVYRTALCAKLKQKISDAFLQIHRYPEMKPWLKYLDALKISPATGEDYNVFWQLLQRKINHGESSTE